MLALIAELVSKKGKKNQNLALDIPWNYLVSENANLKLNIMSKKLFLFLANFSIEFKVDFWLKNSNPLNFGIFRKI